MDEPLRLELHYRIVVRPSEGSGTPNRLLKFWLLKGKDEPPPNQNRSGEARPPDGRGFVERGNLNIFIAVLCAFGGSFFNILLEIDNCVNEPSRIAIGL
jgi:hypothetical protein